MAPKPMNANEIQLRLGIGLVGRTDLEAWETCLRGAVPIYGTQSVVDLMSPIAAQCPHEVLWVIGLHDGRATAIVEVARGGIGSIQVSIATVARTIALLGAPAVVLCHNHPNGSADPSQSDLRMTRKADKICKLLGVSLVDHVIVAADHSFTSIIAKLRK